MMTKVIILCGLIAVALSAPQGQDSVSILSQENVINADGSFSNSFETSDGTKVQGSGQLKQLSADQEGDGEAIQGSFQFVAPDGATYVVTYTADENGFVPNGDHLPVAPPIPEAIARSLEYNAAHPEESGVL